MRYVTFFGLIIPFQLLLVVGVLRLIRRRRPGGDPTSWLALTGMVFLLMVVVNAVSLIPGIAFVALVLWLVGLMSLSGLDVLSTFILSFTLGIVNFGAMILLARYLNIPFIGSGPAP